MRAYTWTLRSASLVALVVPGLASSCHRSPTGVEGSGTIEAYDVQIAPLYAGRIREIHVREGQEFVPGQALVVLQNDELTADLEFSQAGLQAARRGIEQARADYDIARKERLRGDELFRAGSISRQDLDRLVARETVSRSRLDASHAQSGQLEAALHRSKSRVRETILYAPSAGVVLSRNFEPGEVVLPGAAILSVADLSRVRLSVYAPEPQLPRIHLGATAIVRVDGSGQEFRGRVVSVADRAEFTPKNVQTSDARSRLVFEVRIELENPDRHLKPGMPADAVILDDAESPGKK